MLQPDPSTLKHRTLYPFSILVPYSEIGVDLEVGLELEKQWPKQMVKSTWEKRVPNGSEKNEPKKKKKRFAKIIVILLYYMAQLSTSSMCL